MSAADHQNVARYLVGRGTEFYTFNHNPGQMVKFVLRGLPPSTESEEILAGFREKVVEVSPARHIKRNILKNSMRGGYHPPDVGYYCAKKACKHKKTSSNYLGS